MSNQLLSTNEAAQALGISAGTIRSWLSRYPEIFLEDIHLVTVDKRRMWTQAGVELLRTRVNAGDAAEPATDFAAQHAANDAVPIPTTATPVDAATDATGPDPIQSFADAIAWEVIEHRLPGAVQGSIARILADPTEADRDRLLAILERVGSGVTLARMSAIFAGGLTQAIAASNSSLKALGGGSDA